MYHFALGVTVWGVFFGSAIAQEKAATNPLFANRIGEQRKQAVLKNGGTRESEEAVELGLKWIARQQKPDGSWDVLSEKGPLIDPESMRHRSIVGTAYGLLPFLGAGHTHRARIDNPYDKVVRKGLDALIRLQNEKTGHFPSTMYHHALATLAICEAFGMTNDPALRKSAQMGIDLIVNVQGEDGGWRYSAAKNNAGDMSIAGWQVGALIVAKAAGLEVRDATLRRAIAFLETCRTDDGFNYTRGSQGSNRMTAVGVLFELKLQNWGPNQPEVVKALAGHIRATDKPRQDVYYNYYAAQVLFNIGGKPWTDWNGNMRDFIIKGHDTDPAKATLGSWAPEGDPFGKAGGRMMITSMSLLTLQVYYRYPPTFRPNEP